MGKAGAARGLRKEKRPMAKESRRWEGMDREGGREEMKEGELSSDFVGWIGRLAKEDQRKGKLSDGSRRRTTCDKPTSEKR